MCVVLAKDDQTAKIDHRDGVLHSTCCKGEGKRSMQALILDIQATACSFDEAAQATVDARSLVALVLTEAKAQTQRALHWLPDEDLS